MPQSEIFLVAWTVYMILNLKFTGFGNPMVLMSLIIWRLGFKNTVIIARLRMILFGRFYSNFMYMTCIVITCNDMAVVLLLDSDSSCFP